MDAVKLGPFLLPLGRLLMLLVLVVLGLVADLLARRVNKRLSAWGWNVGIAGLAAARIGFVLTHFSDYSRDLLSIFYVWQGGFSVWWGILGGAVYSLWFFRRERRLLRFTLVPPAVAGLVWLGANAVVAHLQAAPRAESVSLPALTLYRIEDGSSVDLGSFKGRPVVLNVWATWCPPCRREMPMMAEVAQQNPGVVFVFADQGEGPETVRAFLNTLPQKLSNVLLDPQQAVSRTQQIVGFPTTFFYDASGKRVGMQTGEVSRAVLSDYLRRIQ